MAGLRQLLTVTGQGAGRRAVMLKRCLRLSCCAPLAGRGVGEREDERGRGGEVLSVGHTAGACMMGGNNHSMCYERCACEHSFRLV